MKAMLIGGPAHGQMVDLEAFSLKAQGHRYVLALLIVLEPGTVTSYYKWDGLLETEGHALWVERVGIPSGAIA